MSESREPFFRAPWPALLIVALILVLHALQRTAPEWWVIEAFAFSPAKLEAGRVLTAVTALFVHGDWQHALVNAAFALAFGTPTARFFGLSARGVLGFFLFYLAMGVLANLGHAVIHAGDPTPLVGASGAVSGLMGAGARLLATRGARLGSLKSREVAGMSLALLIVNLLLAVFGAPGSPGVGVAWEAHLIGFALGLVSIGLFTRLFRRAGGDID